jgi:hypothetical protein
MIFDYLIEKNDIGKKLNSRIMLQKLMKLELKLRKKQILFYDFKYMKKVLTDKIINIEKTDLYDNQFLFEYLDDLKVNDKVEVIFMSDLLEKKKNLEILEKVKQKPAMYSNVYSPEDELEIFKELFEDAIKNNKKIHIV